MATDAERFVLDVRSSGGPELGPKLLERDSRLRVDGKTRLARYEQHRSEAETPGEPIGRFARTLSPAELDALEAAVWAPAFLSARPTHATDVTATSLVISARWGERQVEKLINTSDRDQLGQLDSVLSNITELEGDLLEHPVAAVRVVVRQAGKQFELVIENIGREPVTLADPRFLDGTTDDWAGVRVAADIPGGTFWMLEWKRLKLERPAQGKPAEIHIQPGASFVAKTEPWHRDAAKVPHLAQAILSSYRGPVPSDGKTYRVRGAAFSEIIDVP